MKIFAFGDIHGCITYLEDLFRKVRKKIDRDEDLIVFIGDYIDRGPDPAGVVDFILELRKAYRTVCLAGNHEQMLLDYYYHARNRELYFSNGGTTTIMSYGIVSTPSGKRINIPPEHLEFYGSLLPYYETEKYIFVHAGIKPGVSLQDQDPVDLAWIRSEFIYSDFDFGKTVVFGHTSQLFRPYVDKYKIGIDTGAVYGGKLTCLELPAIRFHQAP